MTLNENNNYNMSGLSILGSNNTLLELNNKSSASNGNCRLSLTGSNFSQWEMGIGGISHGVYPGGLYWATGGTNKMVLTAAGRLGVGTMYPSAMLHCVGQSSYTFGAGGGMVYRLRTDSRVTESALGPITYTTMSAIFDGYLAATATVMSSDRRLKTNIYPISIDAIRDLYHLSVNLQNSSDPILEPKGVRYSIDYPKITCYNMRMIQHLLDEIHELKAKVSDWSAD
ncbi:hypothetical protein Plhal304r1_c034g0107631 [Plasmopara halstedii]